jgi:hypothetical protein
LVLAPPLRTPAGVARLLHTSAHLRAASHPPKQPATMLDNMSALNLAMSPDEEAIVTYITIIAFRPKRDRRGAARGRW